MIDRQTFFTRVRASFGALKQSQVDGFTAILDEWERRKMADLRWLAYMLATAWHETAETMQPIREYGRGAGRPYGIRDQSTGHAYYGRGYVQLTWKSNYASLGKRIGVDLVRKPDLALDPHNAAAILFEGMIDGLFTGKSLGSYFTDDESDWRNARRIINGTDRADKIAEEAKAFYRAAVEASKACKPVIPPAADRPAPAPAPIPAPAPSSPPAAIPAPARPGFWARFLAALTKRTAA